MDIEKLIETLRQHGVSCVRTCGKYCSICDEAATALSTLQAENKRLNKIVCSIPTTPDSGRTVSQYDKEMSMCAYLDDLEAENEKLRETVDKYATAARVIALHLKPFCDESLPYDEMIADAARKASDELEQVERLYESEKEDFIDFACSGVLNLSPYCLNRNPDCVDERGWCRTEKCRGFSRERGQKED